MMGKINIGNLIIGEGMPKICAPLTGETLEELQEQCKIIVESKADLAEWRVDFYKDVQYADKVRNALQIIKETLNGMPLIFTFRTAEEGGERAISMDDYLTLNKSAIASGMINFADIELFRGGKVVKELVRAAEAEGVYTIISNHDFEKTPAKEEITARLKKAIDLGADIPKIAVMPQTEADVLTLLEATLEMKKENPNWPIITMAMGGLGIISRISGGVFGSAITFGAADKASAPGQVSIGKLKETLELIHQSQ